MCVKGSKIIVRIKNKMYAKSQENVLVSFISTCGELDNVAFIKMD